MKIHRLRLENLNSLYGEHELDLDGKLGAATLFLVVGPTGAGKYTLLDAICLALFGATPRLRKPDKVGIRGSSQPSTHPSSTSCFNFRLLVMV